MNAKQEAFLIGIFTVLFLFFTTVSFISTDMGLKSISILMTILFLGLTVGTTLDYLSDETV